MSKTTNASGPATPRIHHPFFAACYERVSLGGGEGRFFEPLRRELIEQAHGVVLEVGAGTGLNFQHYPPEKVERVEATEPDVAMLTHMRKRLPLARVPLTISQAASEALPFASGTFDCAIATLVFCSVGNPVQSFQEIRRTLKPGGTLFLLEHVRSQKPFIATLQDALVPLTTCFTGNCHWNRDTYQAAIQAGFHMHLLRRLNGGFHPILLLQATNPS